MEVKNVIAEKMMKANKVFVDAIFSILSLIVKVIILIGSFSALLLLYKLYPEVGEPLFRLLIALVGVCLKAILFLAVAGVVVTYSFFIKLFYDSAKKKNEEKREKFLEDLTKKIKRSLKK